MERRVSITKTRLDIYNESLQSNISEPDESQSSRPLSTGNIVGDMLKITVWNHKKFSMKDDSLWYYCKRQVAYNTQTFLELIEQLHSNYIDLCDTVDNLMMLRLLVSLKSENVAFTLTSSILKLTSAMKEVDPIKVVNWPAVEEKLYIGEMISPKHENNNSYLPNPDDIKIIRQVGDGGYGDVYLVNYKPLNLILCAKAVERSLLKKKNIATDKGVAGITQNPFIAKYLICCPFPKKLITLMEYINGMCLLSATMAKKRWPMDQSKLIMAQIVLGVEYLHLHGIIHRDLKPPNMIISNNGKIKIFDFETTQFCAGHFLKRHMNLFFLKTAEEFGDQNTCGTPSYLAPETVHEKSYGRAIDWWAVGLISYNLITGRHLFGSKGVSLNSYLQSDRYTFWMTLRDEFYKTCPAAAEFIIHLLHPDPRQRLGSFNYLEIRNHPFFESIEWNNMYVDSYFNFDHAKFRYRENYAECGDTLTSVLDGETLMTGEKILTFVSPKFKTLIDTIDTSDTSIPLNQYNEFLFGDDPMPEIQDSMLEQTNQEMLIADDKSASIWKTQIDITLNRKKAGIFNYEKLGIEYRRVKSLKGYSFFIISKIKAKTPASEAGVTVGDIISKLDGKSVINSATMAPKNKPTSVLSVFLFNPFRISDTKQFIRRVNSLYPVKVTLRGRQDVATRKTFFDIEVKTISIFVHDRSDFTHIHIILSIVREDELGSQRHDNYDLKEGDVLKAFDGQVCTNIITDDLKTLFVKDLKSPTAEIEISPTSILRYV